MSDAPVAAMPQRSSTCAARLLPWVITIACFAFLYTRIDGAARRQGSSLVPYLVGVFEKVDWWSWLALMIPYSLLFFLVDSLVIWRVVNWFNARVPYRDILPVRASTYILSILNEQVGKGVMAYYLNRRDGVPGWQVGSSMLFIMFCEFYYLLTWACVGAMLRWDRVPDAFRVLPWVALGALVFFALWVLYFRGAIAPGSKLRERDMLRSFRLASPWHYAAVIVLRSPALLTAAFVYSRRARALRRRVELPRDARRAAADLLRRRDARSDARGRDHDVGALFPDHPAEMAAFGLVMHNFFIFFNAAIGLVFLRRANRELFGQG